MTWQSTPYRTGETAGQEVGNGNYQTITAVESDLVHPSHSDGFVDAGDPVCFGDAGSGIAKIAGAASTDLISVAMGGIWYLSVNANNGAIAFGEQVYVHTSTAAVTNTSTTARPLGLALGAVVSGETTVIAVLVQRT